MWFFSTSGRYALAVLHLLKSALLPLMVDLAAMIFFPVVQAFAPEE